MKAALFAIKIYGENLYSSPVPHKIDNTLTLSWINKQTAPNESNFGIVKVFWCFYIQRNMWLQVSYIDPKQNRVAEEKSQNFRDNLE